MNFRCGTLSSNAVWQKWRKTAWRHRPFVPVLYGWDDLVHILSSQEMPPGWPISSFTKPTYQELTLQFSVPYSLGDFPRTSVSLVCGSVEEAGLAGVSLLLAGSRRVCRLSYLKASAESRSLRAGSAIWPSRDPTKLRIAASIRGPKPPGRGAVCFVAGAWEP